MRGAWLRWSDGAGGRGERLRRRERRRVGRGGASAEAGEGGARDHLQRTRARRCEARVAVWLPAVAGGPRGPSGAAIDRHRTAVGWRTVARGRRDQRGGEAGGEAGGGCVTPAVATGGGGGRRGPRGHRGDRGGRDLRSDLRRGRLRHGARAGGCDDTRGAGRMVGAVGGVFPGGGCRRHAPQGEVVVMMEVPAGGREARHARAWPRDVWLCGVAGVAAGATGATGVGRTHPCQARLPPID